MNNVNGDIMMCYAVKVGDAFVTFGEWRGEYMLEDVPVQEAAWFTDEQVQSVLDYFEREGAVAVEVQRPGQWTFNPYVWEPTPRHSANAKRPPEISKIVVDTPRQV